jgi:hypothetical protein
MLLCCQRLSDVKFVRRKWIEIGWVVVDRYLVRSISRYVCHKKVTHRATFLRWQQSVFRQDQLSLVQTARRRPAVKPASARPISASEPGSGTLPDTAPLISRVPVQLFVKELMLVQFWLFMPDNWYV